MVNGAPIMGLVVGAAFAVLVTAVLVFVFVRLARREKDSSSKR
jgi:hypothetical protein